MGSEINLNDASPAAPSHAVNVKWQKGATSGTDPVYDIPIYPVSANVAAATASVLGVVKPDAQTINVASDGTLTAAVGGVLLKTASYTATAGDCGKLLSFNSSSAVTLTLPATAPFAQWNLSVENTGTGTLTVSPGALQLDGATSSVTLAQNSGLRVFTDGTNYFSQRGAGAGGGITQLTGDVTAGPGSGSQAATLAASGVTAGTYTNPTVTFDAKGRATSAVSGGTPVAANFAQTTRAPGLTTLSSGTYTPVAGKAIVVGALSGVPSDMSNVTGISDTAGNTWVSLGSYIGTYAAARLWICYSPVTAPTTISLAVSSATGGNVILSLIQYSSLLAQDGSTMAGGSNGSAWTDIATANLTTGNANDLLLVFGGSGYNGGASCSVTTSGFTTDGSGNGGAPPSCFGSQLVSATGTYSANVHMSSGADHLVAVIVAIKTAGSGGGSGVTSFNTRTGAVVAATGDYSFAQLSGSATPSQLPAMVGDSGSGGTAGIVPAPAAGDAAAGKFLKADGTFAVPAAATGSNATQIQGVNVSATAPTTSQVLAYNGTQWAPAAAGAVAYQPSVLPNPPALASWTWVNQGAATVSNNGNSLAITIPDTAALNWRLLKMSTPSAPYSFAAYWKSLQLFSDSQDSGFYLTDGTKLLGLEVLTQHGGGTPVKMIRVERITSVTADNSTVKSLSMMPASTTGAYNLPDPMTGGFFGRFRVSSTTIFVDISMDGSNWTNIYSEAVGAFLTPTAVGFGGVSVTGTSTNYVVNSLQGWLQTASAAL